VDPESSKEIILRCWEEVGGKRRGSRKVGDVWEGGKGFEKGEVKLFWR